MSVTVERGQFDLKPLLYNTSFALLLGTASLIGSKLIQRPTNSQRCIDVLRTGEAYMMAFGNMGWES
jgi:hypothetical protein